MRKKLTLLILISFVALAGVAQNNTSSPYSRFGYGELNDNVPGAYRAMGGVGLAMRNSRVISLANPASISSCDSLTFMLDLAASGMWENYKDATGRRNKANGNLEYLNMQFPIWSPYIAFALGVSPYSVVGYDFQMSDSINSSRHYQTSYYGEGGITQVYGGLGVNLFNWVALGVNLYYMFGDVTNARALTFTEADYRSVVEITNLHVSDIRLRYGLQLFHTFGKHSVSLGGIFEKKSDLNCYYTIIESTSLDTIPIIEGFDLPMVYGGGVAYSFDNRLSVSAEVMFTDWQRVRYKGETNMLRSRMKISAGAEYRHQMGSRKYVENMPFRVGFSLSDSYLPGVATKDYSVSIGVGFPLHNVATVINTSLEYNHRGSSATLQDNSLKLTISASISETWFFKRRL